MLVSGRITTNSGEDSDMSEHAEGARLRRGARPRGRCGRPRRRAATLIAAVAGATMLAAACGGSSAGADTFLGGTYTQSLAYAKCMRSHGVPEFPAPDGQGNFNDSQIQSIIQQDPHERDAFQVCRSLLPNEGTGLTVTQLQTMQEQNLHNAVKAAHCMRAHGITDFPDPSGMTQGSGVNWEPAMSAGLNLSTSSYAAAFKICSGKLVGGPIPPMLAPGAAAQTGPPPGSGGGS
jgi:hypothetical protein